jgi:NO-binding membrane sensor protein with MHYT domain
MRMAADKQDRLHLGLCAISFGLVAIWCMHFVGNKAIVMGDGRSAIQLSYSAGYTALSAVLPVIGLYLGFSVVDRYGKTQRFLYLSLIITGLTAGLSIMGMHYIGNLGTSNYTLENNYKNVIAAAAIAVVDCWLSFTIFFHLREQWINYWWRRFLCAALLAAAVSGMHWTAAVGTSYRLRTVNGDNSPGQNVNVILASILVGYPFPI